MSIVNVNQDECYKCGFCRIFNVCDKGAIKADNNDTEKITKIYIDYEKCNSCLRCVTNANCNAFEIYNDDNKIIKVAKKFNLNKIDNLKPIIRKKSQIKFFDGPISQYGKYIGQDDMKNCDVQYLEMKPHTEDAHVHDNEIEIMVLWGGKFILWVKDKDNNNYQEVESDGEQTCIMVPPGYAHGVKSIGDQVIKIVIIYIPGLTNWP